MEKMTRKQLIDWLSEESFFKIAYKRIDEDSKDRMLTALDRGYELSCKRWHVDAIRSNSLILRCEDGHTSTLDLKGVNAYHCANAVMVEWNDSQYGMVYHRL